MRPTSTVDCSCCKSDLGGFHPMLPRPCCPNDTRRRGSKRRYREEASVVHAQGRPGATVRSLLDRTHAVLEPAAGVTLMFSKSRVFVIEADQVIRSALGYILSERHETLTFSETADALTKAATP